MSLRGLVRTALVLLVLGLLAAGAGALWAWRLIDSPFGAPGSEIEVEVPEGSTATEILDMLERQGVLRNARLARFYLIWGLDDPTLKSGEYRFELPLDTPDVLDQLRRGEVVTYQVTLIEGLTLEESADALHAAGFGDRSLLLELMSDPGLIADRDPAATDLEGYLFPETYSFARGTSEAKIVATLVTTFRRHLDEIEQDLGPHRNLRELVTLASIVEKEAQLDEERPLIAGVYANRLERGIALQADPTVIYAKKLDGTWDGNLRRPDLKLDSPYNTYRYPELPPGPICSPGLASLRAAAQPAETDYLYFVSRNDGSHVFASSLAEHNRNVERWQKRYWRERWARERLEREKSGR